MAVLGTSRRRAAERSCAIVRTAFASTYPPQRDGVATFSHDLAATAGEREIVALVPPNDASPYPIDVHHRIRRDEPGDYARAAVAVSSCVDVVSIQFDHGVWGGNDGASVVDFVKALAVPAVATFHGVMRSPTEGERNVLRELVSGVAAVVVMSRSAGEALRAGYDVEPRRLHIIPHGVPDLPLVDPAALKATLGLDGRLVVLGFGLLGPGKGCELVLDALPQVVASHPTVCYVVVGPTHPDLLRRDGEAFRRSLVDRVARLGLAGHVRFVDRFVGRVERTRWLQAADVVVTPYPDLEQDVSGTLAYAMSAGRAVVSTAYHHAVELLADGRGLLVPSGGSEPMASALIDLLRDDERRVVMGRRAHDHVRDMTWSAVGLRYGRLFDEVAKATPIAAAGRAVGHA